MKCKMGERGKQYNGGRRLARLGRSEELHIGVAWVGFAYTRNPNHRDEPEDTDRR